MTGDLAEAGPPSWGVVLVCVAVACWVATATVLAAVLTAPRRVVHRRPRYRGAHAPVKARDVRRALDGTETT